jgi:membrane fusion protein, copper/silver efflux system
MKQKHGRLRGVVVAAMAVASACAPAPQTSNTPAPGSALSTSIVEPYLNVQQALADDKTDGVKENARQIATAAAGLGAPAAKIDTAAVQLASATELNDARTKFATLSEAVDDYMTDNKLKAPEGVRVVVCPMVQKPWLQKGDSIENPYYGKEMLACGSFR